MGYYVYRGNRFQTPEWAEYQAKNERANREYDRVLSHGISDRLLMSDRTLANIRAHDRERYREGKAA